MTGSVLCQNKVTAIGPWKLLRIVRFPLRLMTRLYFLKLIVSLQLNHKLRNMQSCRGNTGSYTIVHTVPLFSHLKATSAPRWIAIFSLCQDTSCGIYSRKGGMQRRWDHGESGQSLRLALDGIRKFHPRMCINCSPNITRSYFIEFVMLRKRHVTVNVQ